MTGMTTTSPFRRINRAAVLAVLSAFGRPSAHADKIKERIQGKAKDTDKLNLIHVTTNRAARRALRNFMLDVQGTVDSQMMLGVAKSLAENPKKAFEMAKIYPQWREALIRFGSAVVDIDDNKILIANIDNPNGIELCLDYREQLHRYAEENKIDYNTIDLLEFDGGVSAAYIGERLQQSAKNYILFEEIAGNDGTIMAQA